MASVSGLAAQKATVLRRWRGSRLAGAALAHLQGRAGTLALFQMRGEPGDSALKNALGQLFRKFLFSATAAVSCAFCAVNSLFLHRQRKSPRQTRIFATS